MTFDEVERSLPNGFHDATILGMSFDCFKAHALIRLSVHVSNEGDVDRERYRTGRLEANTVHLFFVDRPSSDYSGSIHGGISASGDSVFIGQDADIDALLSKLPLDITAYRFFMDDWNSFFYIAASDVTFSWE